MNDELDGHVSLFLFVIRPILCLEDFLFAVVLMSVLSEDFKERRFGRPSIRFFKGLLKKKSTNSI